MPCLACAPSPPPPVSPQRSSKYANVTDRASSSTSPSYASGKATHGSSAFYSTFNAQSASDVSMAVLVEHYQPYEFPICPVINSDTQRLVKASWAAIVAMEWDSSDTGSGKVSGASFFYVGHQTAGRQAENERQKKRIG